MSDLTLSIVSHGHGAMLDRLLADIAAGAAASRARVVVTLNLADEAFDPQRHAGLDLVVVRNERPRGFGANHNAAFRHCASRWFVILNPDLRWGAEDPLPALLRRAEAETGLGVLAPQVVGPSGAAEDSRRFNLTPASLFRRVFLGDRNVSPPSDIARASSPGPFFWLAGMFLLVDADAFRAIGGFDERYFLYCEDFDLCARMYLAGHAVAFHPGAQVVHAAQRDSHRSARHLRWHVASLLRAWCSRPFWAIVRHDRRRPTRGASGAASNRRS
jgi:N-acetylglucosaminyl-diphospho-decaprenol L-rhamnosyltransferase